LSKCNPAVSVAALLYDGSCGLNATPTRPAAGSGEGTPTSAHLVPAASMMIRSPLTSTRKRFADPSVFRARALPVKSVDELPFDHLDTSRENIALTSRTTRTA
jgi:hypothetical protein